MKMPRFPFRDIVFSRLGCDFEKSFFMLANDEEPIRILFYPETVILDDACHAFGGGFAEFRFDVQLAVGSCG